MYAEAAAVCLDEVSHSQNVILQVKGDSESQFSLQWTAVTDQMKRSYNDLQDSTEFGAYGVALSLVRELTGMSAVLQMRKGPNSGFDYWINSASDDMLQGASRLEVSGILRGTPSAIKERLKTKKKQTEKSDSTGLPAYSCVVEFSKPEAHFVKR